MNTPQSSSFLAGEKLTTGSLSLSPALRPTIVFAGNTENEIRIAEDGIVFRGQKIVDAGQLYNVLRIAMDVEKRPIREQAAPSDIPMWWERLGCVRNPGAHTAEESARDGEIADLRATLLDQMAAWLPSGLAIVPVEPTEEMVGAGFESAPDEFFSPAEEWAAYAEMTGCQKAAYRARLCYAAMLAAAPAAPAQAKPLPVVPAPVKPKECWSLKDEGFSHDSLDELLDNYPNLEVGARVFVGEAAYPALSRLIDSDDVVDQLGDRAYDIAGEYADGYPDVSADDKAELDALLAAWIEKSCPPAFYEVKNVRAYVITEQDIAAQASTAGGRQGGGQS